jgi:hypothetical protein
MFCLNHKHISWPIALLKLQRSIPSKELVCLAYGFSHIKEIVHYSYHQCSAGFYLNVQTSDDESAVSWNRDDYNLQKLSLLRKIYMDNKMHQSWPALNNREK